MEELNSMEHCKTIHESLRYLRNLRNLTQEALGDRIGVDQSYIAQIETQGKIPSPEAIIGILEILNVNSTDLAHIKKQYYQALSKVLDKVGVKFEELERKRQTEERKTKNKDR